MLPSIVCKISSSHHTFYSAKARTIPPTIAMLPAMCVAAAFVEAGVTDEEVELPVTVALVLVPVVVEVSLVKVVPEVPFELELVATVADAVEFELV